MKKIFALLMIFALALMTGCGGQSGDKPAQGEMKLGVIRYMNITETLLDNYFEKASSRMNQTSEMRAPKHVFFDNMSTMIAALEAGQVDEITTYECVGKYLEANNANFESDTKIPNVSDSFCCAMREDESNLKAEFDAAILKLKEDGLLENLLKVYINDANYSAPPTAVEMPTFDGAPTIKIAVTGDLPPLDYVSADGKAAGFNTALLAEISKLVRQNFELVQVDSGARAAALTSGKVDVVFWAAVPINDTLAPPDCDKPEGVILTEPYYTDKIIHIKLKK